MTTTDSMYVQFMKEGELKNKDSIEKEKLKQVDED